jgi:SAM-dependent methyltransferase
VFLILTPFMSARSHLEALWARFLACPACAGDLRPEPAGAAERLTCVGCAKAFPVRDGIPSFVEPQQSEQAAEIVQRDEEAAAYEGMFLAWEDYLEATPLADDLRPKDTDWVLEVGSGTGRILREYVRRAAGVVAIDFSIESLRYVRRSLELVTGALEKVVLVHADACALPVHPGVFDRAISAGMLQHLPSADHRARAVAGMARALRPKGRFVMQARHWSGMHALYDAHRDSALVGRLTNLLIGNASGGRSRERTTIHADGCVALYNTSADELRELVERAGLRVRRVVGRIHGVKGMQRLGAARPLVERVVELVPRLSLYTGQELVVVAKKAN